MSVESAIVYDVDIVESVGLDAGVAERWRVNDSAQIQIGGVWRNIVCVRIRVGLTWRYISTGQL